MWQLWFVYWSVFIVTLIVFFFPNVPTGQFQSIWLAVPVCASPLLSKNWAGGHWLWITKGYLFISIFLMSSLDPSAVPPSMIRLSFSSSSQSDLPFSLLLPFLSHKPDFFHALSCRAGSPLSLCQSHPGPGHSLLLPSAMLCWATLQLGDSTHR